MNVCYIVGAAPTRRSIPAKGENDFLIAADGGYSQLGGQKPDLVVGDFDSLAHIPAHENIIRHPARKDDTDMMLAIKLGLERGFVNFAIYGGLGGRLDHSIANLQALSYLRMHGARGLLAGDAENAMLLQNESCLFSGRPGAPFSVFAYGGSAEGVCLEGFSYPLENAALSTDFPLGVSNALCGARGRVSVRRGMLLVLWSGEESAKEIFSSIGAALTSQS